MEVSFLIETGNWGGGPVRGMVGNGYARQLVFMGTEGLNRPGFLKWMGF